MIKEDLVLGKFSLKPGLNTIGRAKDCDVVLEDANVTRIHARIQVDVNKKIFLFEDLKSTNGSYINQVKTSYKILEKNDVLQLGGQQLLFNGDSH